MIFSIEYRAIKLIPIVLGADVSVEHSRNSLIPDKNESTSFLSKQKVLFAAYLIAWIFLYYLLLFHFLLFHCVDFEVRDYATVPRNILFET